MRNRPTFATCFTAALLSYLGSSVALADSTDEFLRLLNSTQSYQSGQGIRPTDDGNNEGPSEPVNQTAEQYYVSDLDPVVQLRCVGCHQSGGTASNNGARLIFSNSAESNHIALSHFVTDGVRDSDWVLSKITGGSGHGGGTVISSGSNDYETFERYFALLSGDASTGSGSQSDFWDGLFMEPREVTLRRASLLLAARVASDESIERAKDSDEALRGEIIKLMRGEGFHDFLVSGANDQLLVDGLMVRGEGGIPFAYRREELFPAFSQFAFDQPKEMPEWYGADDYDRRLAFLTQSEAWWDLDWTVRQEPLELIAHVVMTNQSYKKILTADYAMVNPVSNIAYRSGLEFDAQYPDAGGLYDSKLLNQFKPGHDRGQVPWENGFFFDNTQNLITSFTEYRDFPHSGVLSTPAWLNRYPSTDTNRNRARARWTYYHFLGVDIEKSAPRTTDPIALADTNNPTLNNAACTVCHERLDQVAGAYKMFGDNGVYLDQWGGEDSLPNSYKSPHLFGGTREDQIYLNGDTWYRDMRLPGLEGKEAPQDQDSLQWLAHQIAEDPRFASATVKFWWPAVYGSELLMSPEDPGGPDYDQRLRAFNAQETLIEELSEKFVNSDYRLKQLLAEMVLAAWYRSETPEAVLEDGTRDLELATIGRGRLLTPRELDNKNIALFGYTWFWERTGNTSDNSLDTSGARPDEQSALHRRTSDDQGYNVFFGGIDSASLIKRNRELTPLMVNVTSQMAVDLACQAVAYDFSLPKNRRKMFTHVERDTFPGDIASEYLNLSGVVADADSWVEHGPISLKATHSGGTLRIQISDTTTAAGESKDTERASASLAITELKILQNEAEKLFLSGYQIPEHSGFQSAIFVEPNGRPNEYGRVLDAKWAMEPGGWTALELELPQGNYELQLQLATRLSENNVNEAVRAHVAMTSLNAETDDGARSAIRQQIATLFRNATNEELSDAQIDEVAAALSAYAQRELVREVPGYNGLTWNSGENWCVDWGLFSIGGKVRKENPTLHHARYNDPRAMIRAWTMLTHQVMQSFGYLHD